MGPNDENMANTTLAFLERADMKGGEVDAFIAVKQWVREKGTPAEEIAPAAPSSPPQAPDF